MRHAKSEWNVKLENYLTENNLDKNAPMNHTFKTSYQKPEQVDAAITQESVTDCKQEFQNFQENYPKIKYVFCSPYRRTFQTMNLMFQDYPNKLEQKNVILCPSICEGVFNIGDFAFETRNLMNECQELYDWGFYSKENYEDPEIWFQYNIQELGEKNQLKSDQINNWKQHQDKEKLFELWRQNETKIETKSSVRKRMEKAKLQVSEFIKENNVQDYELMLVSHSFFINFFISKNFDERDGPIEKHILKNLDVIEYEFNE